MFPQLINLTLLYVNQEVNQVLREYPIYPYQEAFSKPYLRQKLIARVLNRIPNRHIVIENREDLLQSSNLYQCTATEQLRIENLIYEAIFDLMPDTMEVVEAEAFRFQN